MEACLQPQEALTGPHRDFDSDKLRALNVRRWASAWESETSAHTAKEDARTEWIRKGRPRSGMQKEGKTKLIYSIWSVSLVDVGTQATTPSL